MTAPTSTIVQRRNAEMTALATADLLSSNDKNCATEAYATGTATFTLGTTATINLNILRYTSFPEVFALSSGSFMLLEYGLYHFFASVTAAQNGGSSSAGLVTWIEESQNGGGAWTIIPPSESYFTVAPISGARASGYINFLWSSQPNFLYRLRVTQSAGSGPFITVANFCKIGCVRLFKNG